MSKNNMSKITRFELITILARIADDLNRTANYHRDMGDMQEALKVMRDAYIYSKVLDILTNDEIAKRLVQHYITDYEKRI